MWGMRGRVEILEPSLDSVENLLTLPESDEAREAVFCRSGLGASPELMTTIL